MTDADTGYTVMIEPFARPGERTVVARATTASGAAAMALLRVRDDLRALHVAGETAGRLFEQWCAFGDDVFVVPADPFTPFSAMDLARRVVVELTGDESLPVVIEVACEDQIVTAGGATGDGHWTFWVRIPASYAGAWHLVRRAVDDLYEGMSVRAYDGDGSTYRLRSCAMRVLDDDEREAAPWRAPGASLFAMPAAGWLRLEAVTDPTP